jgi:hypothetical protein
LNFLLPLSKTLSPFDVIPFGQTFFFQLARPIVQVGVDEKGHNLSHLLVEGKP